MVIMDPTLTVYGSDDDVSGSLLQIGSDWTHASGYLHHHDEQRLSLSLGPAKVSEGAQDGWSVVHSMDGKKKCNGVADLIFQYVCPSMMEELKGQERYQ